MSSRATAKNVILAGVKAVTLQDAEPAALADLGAQFYLSEADVGKNRAEACAARLQELNPAVEVAVVTEAVTPALVAKHRAVVCTETDHDAAVAVNEACRAAGAAFIRGDVRGVFGRLFCDFGETFDVLDVDGEEPHSCIIASVSNDEEPLVTCVDDERVELQDGQRVSFAEVRGMTELNGGVYVIKDVKAHSFKLANCDSSGFGAYAGGGIATQVKETKRLEFKTLAELDHAPEHGRRLRRLAVLHEAVAEVPQRGQRRLGRRPRVAVEDAQRPPVQRLGVVARARRVGVVAPVVGARAALLDHGREVRERRADGRVVVAEVPRQAAGRQPQ